jgi:uncharacterized delta-60 repeat protein
MSEGTMPTRRTRRRGAATLVLMAVLLAALSGHALAAPGDLDPSFDGDGKKTFGDTGTDSAEAVLVQPDRKLVLSGQGGGNVTVARLNPDGSFDSSFGDGGTSGADFGGDDFGYAAALQPNGKIVVAGRTSVNQDIAVARFNPNGSLDSSFDPGGTDGPGKKILPYDGTDFAQAVQVQPDRKIVVAGYGNAHADFVVTRLHPNGSFDTSFGDDGTSWADFGGYEYGVAAALQPDGKVVVAGSTSVNYDIAVVRFNPNGSLDAGFDPGGSDGPGKKTFDYGGLDVAQAVLVQPDHKIVLAGRGGPNRDFAVTRLNPDGSFDTSFGDGGTSAADFGGDDEGFAAALQRNGKIVVAGNTPVSEVNDDVAVARLQPDGTLDTTFSFDGRTTVNFGGFDFANAVALQPDGRIVLAGSSNDFAVARLEGDPPAGEDGGPGGPGGGAGSGSRVPRCAGRRATIVGTARRDVLRGTRRADVIVALGGNDWIRAARGSDRVCGGPGNDNLAGDAGRDRLLGGAGNDRLSGGPGNDRLLGQAGRDRLLGGAGADRLAGGGGRDICLGGIRLDRSRCEATRSG